MKWNLFLLVDVKYGGFVTYARCLLHALHAVGEEANLFRIGKKFENKPRLLHDVPYQNVTLDFALDQARSKKARTLIVCAYTKQYPVETAALLEAGAAIVVHDPTEMTGDMSALLLKHRSPVVCIRQINFDEWGKLGFNVHMQLHPYKRTVTTPVKKTKHAVSISRVDFDKHTYTIAEANTLLSVDKRIDIYGAVNRMFAFHKLDTPWPLWEREYRGAFAAGKGSDIAADYKFVVDMSLIKGDGGGTLYTCLEAWDAGSVLVLDSRWFTPTGDMQPGVNCVGVEGAAELVKAVTRKPDLKLVEAGFERLKMHSYERTVAQLAGLWG